MIRAATGLAVFIAVAAGQECERHDACITGTSENAPSLLQTTSMLGGEPEPSQAKLLSTDAALKKEADAAKAAEKEHQEDMERIRKAQETEQIESRKEAEQFNEKIQSGSMQTEANALDDMRLSLARRSGHKEQEEYVSEEERKLQQEAAEQARQRLIKKSTIKTFANNFFTAVDSAKKLISGEMSKVKAKADDLGVSEELMNSKEHLESAKSMLLEDMTTAKGKMDSAVDTLAEAEVKLKQTAHATKAAVEETANTTMDLFDKAASEAKKVIEPAEKTIEENVGKMSGKALDIKDELQSGAEDVAIDTLMRLNKAVGEEEKFRNKQVDKLMKTKDAVETIIQERADTVRSGVESTLDKADKLEAKVEELALEKIKGKTKKTVNGKQTKSSVNKTKGNK